ncbi:hypothetical protein BaRGS_00000420 [Batillaria attramentaria]|uniref:LAGLIDADG homing endonuclease n=1 Tax=Batillaria attramentaria TaxID=370345 RepID=A0ABD0M9R1_9CAEN
MTLRRCCGLSPLFEFRVRESTLRLKATVVVLRSEEDIALLKLICALGGGSAALGWRRRVWNSGGTGSLSRSLLKLPCDAALWLQQDVDSGRLQKKKWLGELWPAMPDGLQHRFQVLLA